MSQLDAMLLTSSYARVLLAQFATREAELLAGSGLSSAMLMEADRISVRQQLAIFGNAARIAEPGWALRYAAGISAAMHGAMGVAAVSAPTLRDGLAVLARFARTRDPYMDFRLFELPDALGIECVTDIHPLGELDLPMVEICLSFAFAMLRVMAGAEADACRMTIMAAAPPHAARYADFLSASCTFGAERNALILPLSLAGARSLVADPALHRDAQAACARELAALGALFPDETRVRWLIEANLSAPPGLADVARALGRSERALSRQLAASGTSFRTIRDACHVARAKELLRATHLPLAEIAARTGFDDAANFSRAFRRVTGMAPGAYRRTSDAPHAGEKSVRR
jgi:AraC-like DNA-binding protein